MMSAWLWERVFRRRPLVTGVYLIILATGIASVNLNGWNPMATEDFKRKLSAILSADVAGYGRPMGEDDGTVLTLVDTEKAYYLLKSLVKIGEM